MKMPKITIEEQQQCYQITNKKKKGLVYVQS
jgi:hypothetical protein